MKRKLESDEELATEIDCGDVDEFRDQLLEQDEFVRVVKLCGKQPNLALPQDWVGMYHKSGGIIYLHRKTRVCTWARPYHIGQASVRKHDVPTAAIPCLHQIKALNNQKKQNNPEKKRKPLDTHDGIIGHHTGNLDNHCDDHDDHHGNHGNDANCNVNSKMTCDVGTSCDNSDGGAGGSDENKDSESSNIDGCQRDSDGSQNNPDGNHKGDNANTYDDHQKNDDGCQSNNDGGHRGGNLSDGIPSNPDGNGDGGHDDKCDSNLGNSDGNLGNSDGSQSNPDSNDDGGRDGNRDGNLRNNDDSQSNPVGTRTDNSHVITNYDIDSTSDISASITHDVSNMNMEIDHNNDIAAINKTISSIKALENFDSDSDSGNFSENPETLQLQMSSVDDIANYLGKLWEFHPITKEQERKLVLTDTNEIPQDPTEEYKSTQILRTIPYLVQGINPKSKSNEKIVINPAGKSVRSLLHEYCLKVMQVKPEYTTKESEVPKTPFLATVQVDGLLYGSGMAASKKQAKTLAAQKTLEIFMPDSFEKLMNVQENLKIFDNIPVEDPNIYELTSKLGLLSPYQVLNECIKRNQGVLTSEVKFELHHGTDKQLYYTMECGKHKATGTCRNKKLGRELAAQAVLQKLHPHLKSWGAVLRIYVDEHTAQEFTKPEAPASTTSTSQNKELLCELKHEMWKMMKKKSKTSATTGFITNIDI